MDRKKAQSEIIGVILILGITFASIGVILLLGQPVLSDATNDATVDRVQNEMVTLDARLTAVSRGTSVNESLSFSLEGGTLRSDSDATRLNVTLEDGTEVYNRTIGNIEYENGDTAIAYEAGGIWRRNTLTGGSFMVSSPDFDFDGETLTLPVYNVTTDIGYSGPRNIPVRGGNNTRYYPDATDKNPVDGNVTVTVETDYYRAWERYFENELRGNATVNETANEVKAELLAIETPDSINWAGASTAEGTSSVNNVFGSFKGGVEFPSVDDDIESYVEYGESNPVTGPGSGPVTDLFNCRSSICDNNDPVLYNATDYTMNGEDIDADSGNVTVIVDGDLTVDNLDAAVDTGPDTLTIVTTGDLIFSEGYNIQIGNSEVPSKLIFQTTSNGEVIFEGKGGDGYGTVYAPDSLVSLSEMGNGAGSTWTGPVVGRVFDTGGVDSDAQINLGGSSVDVQRADSGIDLYVTERKVGIE
jgi:flagellin-like protein